MVASMAPGGSGCNRSTLIAREVSTASAAIEKAVETRIAEEAAVAKAAKEATSVKVAADKAMADKVVVDKAAVDNVMVEKVAADKAVVTEATEEAVVKVAADAVAMKIAGQGASLLAQRWDPRGWLRRAAPLLPCGSTMLGNLGTQSNSVVAIFRSFYSVYLIEFFC
jgi:hypothetical protein